MPRKGEASKRKGEPSPNSGMKGNQKMKPYLILQILQQQSDENHLLTIDRIRDELSFYGIRQRSICFKSDLASAAFGPIIAAADGE